MLCAPSLVSCISFDSYIKPQLKAAYNRLRICCISFDSYIKPQLRRHQSCSKVVVYLLIPTSNHNLAAALDGLEVLYIF